MESDSSTDSSTTSTSSLSAPSDVEVVIDGTPQEPVPLQLFGVLLQPSSRYIQHSGGLPSYEESTNPVRRHTSTAPAGNQPSFGSGGVEQPNLPNLLEGPLPFGEGSSAEITPAASPTTATSSSPPPAPMFTGNSALHFPPSSGESSSQQDGVAGTSNTFPYFEQRGRSSSRGRTTPYTRRGPILRSSRPLNRSAQDPMFFLRPAARVPLWQRPTRTLPLPNRSPDPPAEAPPRREPGVMRSRSLCESDLGYFESEASSSSIQTIQPGPSSTSASSSIPSSALVSSSIPTRALSRNSSSVSTVTLSPESSPLSSPSPTPGSPRVKNSPSKTSKK